MLAAFECFNSKKFKVYGYDQDINKIKTLNSKKLH